MISYSVSIILSLNIIFVEGNWNIKGFTLNKIKFSGNLEYLGLFSVLQIEKLKNRFRIESKIENKDRRAIRSIFNDPGLEMQWYLKPQDYNSKTLSHNLEDIWKSGITGKGILVAICESGVDIDHVDLRDNFYAEASYDFVHDTSIIKNENAFHPTNMAGIVSAVGNNSICGVGAAPNSRFSNLVIFTEDTQIVHEKLAKAYSYKNDEIDIYSNSWGSANELSYMDGPDATDHRSIRKAIILGRKGYGSIFLFSAGNTRHQKNSCAFNGYPQIPGVFTVSSLTEDGEIPFYIQSCTAIVFATLSNKLHSYEERIYTTHLGNSCFKKTTATSASTALASGILSLLLEANNNLSVRQILFLIATTSMQYDPGHIVNSAGYKYSIRIGFGLLNASSLIKEANSAAILSFPSQNICKTKESSELKNGENEIYESWIYSSGCYSMTSCVTHIEEVIFKFSLEAKQRNHVTIFITSPSGTRTPVIRPRPEDESNDGFKNWRVKMLTFYGEPTAGLWKIEVVNPDKDSVLKKWKLSFYGPCTDTVKNEIIHKKIKIYMCQNKKKIGLYLFLKLCRRTFKPNPKDHVDVYSFSKANYARIDYLNEVLNSE